MSTSITSGSGAGPVPRNASQACSSTPGADSGASPSTTTCSTAVCASSSRRTLEALGRRHEDAHAAVVEDVGDLLGLQHRVDRDEDAAGGRGPEDRHDGLDPLVEVDADALAALQADLAEARGEGRDVVPQLAVGERGVLERQRGRRQARRRAESATIWWSWVCIVRCLSLWSGGLTTRGRPARCTGSRSEPARGSGSGTSFAAATRPSRDSRGRCSTTARSTSVAGRAVAQQQVSRERAGHRAEQLRVADVQDRGEQGQALAPVLAEDRRSTSGRRA